MNGTIRHMFLGGNTSKGFYSFYRYIISQEEARRIICIKGGPGTGKSSLMKKVGQYFAEKGYDVEFHHCSSDNNSLDGIVIKGLNVAMVDGTSPHIVDPINPGAVDEILNMGQYWREEGFKENRKDIMDVNKEVGKLFKRAYRFLGSAKIIHDDWSSINGEALNFSKLNLFKEELKEKLLPMPVSILGTERHLFATAFTPNGIVTYLDTLYKDYKNIYVLNGGPGTGKSDVLKYLSEEAIRRNLYVEIFHDPFIPERLEHILIPELSTAILTSNEINKKLIVGTQIYMEDFCNKAVLAKYKDDLEYNKTQFYNLIDKALTFISRAKALHDDMEKYYIKNMNFDKITLVFTDIIEKLNKYEAEIK